MTLLLSSPWSISILWLAVAPVGMWAKAQPVGEADRPHIHGHSAFVGLARCAVAQALVLALLVIKAEPGADAGLGLGDTGIGVEVDLLVFEAAPQPLDEDVVHVAAHADGDRVALQGVGEIVAGELAALVGIEDLRP